MTDLHYDNAPRPITEDEAKTIAHEEYVLQRGYAAYSGADGGYHLFEPLRQRQDAVTYINVKRADLRRRIMAGECTHTVFYDRARDKFYMG
jgi:muramidase (phage lysozyme)